MIMPAARILDFSEIPVVDIGPLVRGESRRESETVNAIARACQDVGFMYVRNHGMPAAVLDGLVDRAKLFSLCRRPRKKALRSRTRRSFAVTCRSNIPGMRARRVQNLQEGFMIMHERSLAAFPMHGPNQWPGALPSLPPAMRAYFGEMEKLATPLITAWQWHWTSNRIFSTISIATP